MSRHKTKGCKRLLELLGADPHEPPPADLEEARHLSGYVEAKRTEPVLCPVSGKHSFPSQSAARHAATNRLRKGSNTGKLRQYLCPDCAHWHLSSSFH